MPSRKPLMVAIAGGSGSGKSWLAEQLAQAFKGKVARICLDDFYLDRSHLSAARRARINFDHPRAIDWNSVLRALKSLRLARPAQLPCYDFTSHCRLAKIRPLGPKPVVIVEGLWPFRTAALRRLYDVNIFIECDPKTRLKRRLARDLAFRGRTPASIIRQFRTAVEPMHCRYVSPQARWADIVLRSSWGKTEFLFLVALLRSMLRKRQRPGEHIFGPGQRV